MNQETNSNDKIINLLPYQDWCIEYFLFSLVSYEPEIAIHRLENLINTHVICKSKDEERKLYETKKEMLNRLAYLVSKKDKTR